MLTHLIRAKQLFAELVYDGIFVDVIHADRPKRERDNIIQGFRQKKVADNVSLCIAEPRFFWLFLNNAFYV